MVKAYRRHGRQYRPKHLVAGSAEPDLFYADYRLMLVVVTALLADVGFAAGRKDGFTF